MGGGDGGAGADPMKKPKSAPKPARKPELAIDDPWAKGWVRAFDYRPITIATRIYPDGRTVCRARWLGHDGFDVVASGPTNAGAALGRLLRKALTPEGIAGLRAALDEPTAEESAREAGAA